MEQKQGTDINAVLKEITYLRAKADQLELNLVELLIKENKMIQSQYQMALQKLQENEKKEGEREVRGREKENTCNRLGTCGEHLA